MELLLRQRTVRVVLEVVVVEVVVVEVVAVEVVVAVAEALVIFEAIGLKTVALGEVSSKGGCCWSESSMMEGQAPMVRRASGCTQSGESTLPLPPITPATAEQGS